MSSSPGRTSVMRRTSRRRLSLGPPIQPQSSTKWTSRRVAAFSWLTRRIGVKMQLFVVSHQEMIALLGEVGRLHEVGELPVGHPKSRPGESPAHLGQQLGHELHVIGIPIAVGTHRHRQSALEIHRHQRASTQHAAASTSQRLQPFGHMLDRLTVEHDDTELLQTTAGAAFNAVFGNTCRSRSVHSARNPWLSPMGTRRACRRPPESTRATDRPPGRARRLCLPLPRYTSKASCINWTSTWNSRTFV